MNIKYEIVLGLILFVFMVSASFLIFNQEKPLNDDRIWCYEKTVETLDGLVLEENEGVVHTRGGIDIFKKCE